MYHNNPLVLEWAVKQFEKKIKKSHIIIFSCGLALGKKLELDYKVDIVFAFSYQQFHQLIIKRIPPLLHLQAFIEHMLICFQNVIS
jgi:hypothetical protein